MVRWANELQGKKHLLPVDENLHWAYSLHGDSSAHGVDYRQYSIRRNGVPIITHLHGGHTDFQYDGNPEFFYSPDGVVQGPRWDAVPGGFTTTFRYDNDVPAGNLWYHDHALGITRLNVYAGLAGFYFVRDEFDTGMPGNPLGLPAFPYELAYAIQDRMFADRGQLFYPAFPRDPAYADFITEEGAELPPTLFPGGGTSALAEFFGDHMVVNGKIWPRTNVEPRHYRLRLLNGCDSRFLVLRFVAVEPRRHRHGWRERPTAVLGDRQRPGARHPTADRHARDRAWWSLRRRGRLRRHGRAPSADDQRRRRRAVRWGDPGTAGLQRHRPRHGVRRRRAEIGRAGCVLGGGVAGLRRRGGTSHDTPGGAVRGHGRVRSAATAARHRRGRRVRGRRGQRADVVPADPRRRDRDLGDLNFTADAHPVHLHLVHFEILDRSDFEYDVTGTKDTVQHNGTSGESPEISHIQNLRGPRDHAGARDRTGQRQLRTRSPTAPTLSVARRTSE